MGYQKSISMLVCASMLLLVGCGPSKHDMEMLKGDIVRLRDEISAARHQAGRAVETTRSLDLQTEMHAFLQRDEGLSVLGNFPALEDRILKSARSYTFLLRSDLNPRQPMGLFFKPGTYLRVDFMGGSGYLDTDDNRLEVFARPDMFDFEPVNVAKTEHNSYMVLGSQHLILQTTEPMAPILHDGVPMSQILFRYHPEGGPSPYRVAYVRISFIEEGVANPTEAGVGAMPDLSAAGDEEY